MKRKAIPALLVKKLFHEAATSCPFCGHADVASLQIHHINEDPDNNEFMNLIVVCANCHSKITHGEISMADVDTKKRVLIFRGNARKTPAAGSQHEIHVTGGRIENSIIANTVRISGRRPPKMQYPSDSIGADVIRKGYIDYLIKRYFDYKKLDAYYSNNQKFNHAEIHNTVFHNFKAKTFFIPVGRFEELSDYLKFRIDRTIAGKRNQSNGVRNYDSFDEYYHEQLGK